MTASKPNHERVTIKTLDTDNGRYVRRMLELMYRNWGGTLEYERGVHCFRFYSPFDELLRRVTVFAEVAVDGESSKEPVRTYVLAPYLLIQDLRTKLEGDDPWLVLHGDLSVILPSEGRAA